MTVMNPPIVNSDPLAEDYTRITFTPDLGRFNMVALDETILQLMKKRTVDVAGTLDGVEVSFNGQSFEVFWISSG